MHKCKPDGIRMFVSLVKDAYEVFDAFLLTRNTHEVKRSARIESATHVLPRSAMRKKR